MPTPKKNGALKISIIFFLLLVGQFFVIRAIFAAGAFQTPSLEVNPAYKAADTQAEATVPDFSAIKIQAPELKYIPALNKKYSLLAQDTNKGFFERKLDQLTSWFQEDLWEEVILAGGSKALGSAMRSALNTIAMDTATWLGSGGNGQKPLFYTEGWGAYLTNVADNAAGTFVEQLGKQNGYAKFNLCKPNFALQMKIGLGLVQSVKPSAPACTFTKLVSNWENELTSEDFMQKIQSSFDPNNNDFGVAFSLQTGMFQQIAEDKYSKLLTREEGQGYVNDPTGKISGALGIPIASEVERKNVLDSGMKANAITQYTGYALVDAANVFINQLAVTAFNELMKKLGGKSYTSSYGNWNSLISNFSAGPDATIGGGITATKNQLRKIVEPQFNVRGDYNILSELSSCPKPDRAGPTNCVIDEKFKQGILDKKTVAEAVRLGYLNGEKVVGFSSDGVEPRYTDAYPYRTLLILRKFRILPVGWEIAAQYIRDNLDSTKPNGVGPKTLADLMACFDQNDEFPGYFAAWCQGLVDPHWLLKAPLNYCRREGPGPENISDDDSTLVRNDKYCADEQSCIKEKADGSCEYYGYCTEERRKWKFNTDSCEPLYNTCQTFKKEDGASVSYLKNTLDYSGCTVDNAGCTDYCTAYNFSTGKYSCTASSTGNKVFLDRDAQSCDSKSEGCTSFIRARDGLGANLLLNSSFEEDLANGTWSAIGATSSDAFSGFSSLLLNPGVMTKNFSAGPGLAYVGGEYNVEGESYTISLYSKNCPAGSTISLKDGANTESASIESGGTWQLFSLSHVFLSSGPSFDFEFNTPAGSSCLIDAIKMEKSIGATPYSDYGATGLITEKYAPSYLGCDGVADPAECKDFARSCKFEEVGCELYTPTNGGLPVPGKVKPGDYCVAECVGFDTYLQSQTTFDSLRPDYFIPKTAKSCSAELNGCDQFTNLDKLGSGAEATEYYSYLRQCVTSGGTQFYTWEGSNETGFQLKVVSLKADDDTDDVPLDLDGNPVTPDIADYVGDPAVTGTRALEVAKCNEKIYQLKQTDPGYNPDCREYYNTAGVKSYHLYSQTISEDSNCHPYRRTEVNIDPSITLQAACVGADKNWNASTTECAVCINGGVWNAQQGACIYQAIPGQGTQCSAAANGCREYTGNTGQTVKILSNSDFEDSTLQGWASFNGADVPILSTESINMGGHSLYVKTTANNQGVVLAMPTSTMLTGSSYAITLIAKTRTPVNLKVRSTNAAAANVDFIGIGALTADWQMYRANLSDMTVIDPINLIIEADVPAEFFVDNIKLSEISNRFYLLKNSWNTPETCNQDLNKKPYPLYMLGCNEYKDRDNLTYYLRSFSYLCKDDAIGCELMVDIHNSTNPKSENFNTGTAQTEDDLTVLADNYIYAVYDKKKLCKSEDVGCQRLGKPYDYSGERLHSDVYLKNNPDNYKTAMCDYPGLSCDEYSSDDSVSYFKNPYDLACEWRPGPKNVYSWYKKRVNRCDVNNDGSGEGALCADNAGCSAAPGYVGVACTQSSQCNPATPAPQNNVCDKGVCRSACSEDRVDHLCSTDFGINPKTFGIGTGQRTSQPTRDVGGTNWVGLCPAEESSCTELVDPKSSFNQNLIFNNDFAQNINLADEPNRDGWPGNVQGVKLDANTLYILSGTGNAGSSVTVGNCTSASGGSNVSLLSANTNTLNAPQAAITLNLGANPVKTSLAFYSNNSIKCQISIVPAGVVTNLDLGLYKAAVDYQLDKGLDATGCNGLVDQSQGCVLFNKRSQDGASVLNLNYDADTSSSTPSINAGLERDSNVLLKVAPDRICDKWLSCRSSVTLKDQDGNDKNVCLDIALCNQFGFDGGCNGTISKDRNNQTYNYPNLGGGLLSASQVGNISGYAKVGKNQAGQTDAQIPFGSMIQYGAAANVYNGNMELAGDDGYPVGWKYYNSNDVWDEKSFKVINTVAGVQNEGVGSAPEGNGILKLGVRHEITSNSFTVKGGEFYVLQTMANTARLKGDDNADRVHMRFFCTDNAMIEIQMDDRQILPGELWHQVMSPRVQIPNNCSRASVRFSADNGMEGNFFVDDVKVKPVLESRQNEYTSQSCRLYPKSEAKSCQYQDSMGIRYNGWYGYCLEKDRYPGSKDACLLWWPVDKINGDPFSKENTFKGYDGKFPAYYCAELDGNYRYVEKRSAAMVLHQTSSKACFWGNFFNALILGATGGWSILGGFDILGYNGTSASGGPYCPTGAGYLTQTAKVDCSCGFWDTDCTQHYYTYCLPASRKYVVSNAGETNNEWSGGAWYQFNGSLLKWQGLAGPVTTEIDNSVKILDMSKAVAGTSDGELVDPSKYDFLPCKKFYQTVSETGENKVWLGRLGEDSRYSPLGLGYQFKQDDAPFGSAVPPSPEDNPYDWDGHSKTGRQPISFKLPESQEVRAGSPYACTGAKCSQVGHCADSGRTCVSLTTVTEPIDLCATLGAAGTVSGAAYATPNLCYTAENTQVVPVNVMSTECTRIATGLACTPQSTAGCNCISQPTGLPGPAPANATICRNAASAYCDPGVCSGPVGAASCNTVVIGVTNVTTAAAGGPSDNLAMIYPSSASTTNPNARTWTSPEYACEYGEECVITPQPDWPVAAPQVARTAAQTYPALENLKRMFAKNYGVWVWNPATKHYEKDNNPVENWDINNDPAAGFCASPRPAWVPAVTNDYCRIRPTVDNVLVDKSVVHKGDNVILTFNSHVDVNQLPVVYYKIVWGDGKPDTVVTGEFSDRPNANNPHVVTHRYEYNDIQGCSTDPCGDTNGDGVSDTLRPTVILMDNWGTESLTATGPVVSVFSN
ncbi:hypothetical protein HGA34_01980 [Candidatus Falkowbacteria bacterium]|nr:hypothetical protein [Candidatus Falkowbacteria bacterium]